MSPELSALVVHDLKNALGALEAELLTLAEQPERALAAQAHARCAELRQRFVMFLTVYGIDGRMRARANDESPMDLLHALAADATRFRPPGLAAGLPASDGGYAAATGATGTAIATATAATNVDIVVSDSEGDGAPPFWYFDRRLVRMALQAALHNAQRFARSRIVLQARRHDDFLVLAIDDDGPGLGAAEPSQHATGLGTALCDAVARAHEHRGHSGRVTLQNVIDPADPHGLPLGARFELWLP